MRLRIAVLVLVVPVVVHAQAAPGPALQPPSLVAPQPASAARWYGWEILLADGAVFGLAATTRNPSALYGWAATGALVHWAHGNASRGLASASLRVGLPSLGILAGLASASHCHREWCGLGEAIAGALAGAITAEILDVGVLARDRVRAHRDLSPIVRADHAGVGIGVAGRF